MAKLIKAPIVRPLEVFVLPADLDGRHGENRALGRGQLAATNDVEAIKAWLARFADTPSTLASYRKEAERLLLWATVELGKPLSSLTHEDCLAYQKFIEDPQPASRWVMKSARKCARSDPDWRPFAGGLAPTSQRQAMVILNTLFAWLVTAGYLAGNPLSLSRIRQRKAKSRITRLLETDQWAEVKEAISALPQETERQREHHARVRWLFSLLYICGARISDVIWNTMGGFYCRRTEDGSEQWWLEVTGKGDKERKLSVTKELITELTRYRVANKLPPYPTPGEVTPLLLPIGRKPRPLTRSAVHRIVKEIFARTAARVRARGPESERMAASIEAASAHWLRHTAGSSMAHNKIDLVHVRDNLGHASISTTNQYLHSEDDARHQETEEKHRLDW